MSATTISLTKKQHASLVALQAVRDDLAKLEAKKKKLEAELTAVALEGVLRFTFERKEPPSGTVYLQGEQLKATYILTDANQSELTRELEKEWEQAGIPTRKLSIERQQVDFAPFLQERPQAMRAAIEAARSGILAADSVLGEHMTQHEINSLLQPEKKIVLRKGRFGTLRGHLMELVEMGRMEKARNDVGLLRVTQSIKYIQGA